MTDLAAWLLEQITEDEQRARSALWVSNDRFASGDLPFWERRYHVIKQIDERTADGDTIRQRDVADCGNLNINVATHIVHWEPARVLAECDAKRRAMARSGPFCDCGEHSQPMDPDTNWTVPIPHHYDCSAYEAAKIFAVVYAGRPGYREEWRP